MHLLIVGFNARPLALSLRELGHVLHVADFFGDSDLAGCCSTHRAVVDLPEFLDRGGTMPPARALYQCALELLDSHADVEGAIVGSGWDDHPDLREELGRRVEVLGPSSGDASRVRSTRFLREVAKRAGWSFPRTLSVKRAIANDWDDFPSVYKPEATGGGVGLRFLNDADDLAAVANQCSGQALSRSRGVVQKFVPGTPCSVTGLWWEGVFVPLTINSQLVGLRQTHAPGRFHYCGNQVPLPGLNGESSGDLVELVRELGDLLPLRGVAGFDFVLSPTGRPFLIEVNPRVPGSLQCCELATGANLMELHLSACLGFGGSPLPQRPLRCASHATKLVYYAPVDLASGAPPPAEPNGAEVGGRTPRGRVSRVGVFDIPRPGWPLARGDPWFTTCAAGTTPLEACNAAKALGGGFEGRVLRRVGVDFRGSGADERSRRSG
ncbi:MAG: ATP-grasp domain-containing protein [Promethearchaeota archaeon]